MKKLFVAVLFVSTLSFAESVPAAGAHNGPQQPPTQPVAQPQPTADKSSKLFEYVSACLAERPSSSNLQDLLSRFK